MSKRAYETYPQISRRMELTRERGTGKERNVKDGGYFHFLRSHESERKVINPVTGNRVKIRSLVGVDDRRARRLFNKKFDKFNAKWKTRLKQRKENQKARQEGRKPERVERVRKDRKPRRPRRPRKPPWRKARYEKRANLETALLDTLLSLKARESRKVGFHHEGGRYRLEYGYDGKDHYVHLSLMEGRRDPSYLLGKLVGDAAHIVQHMWRMPKAAEIMAFTDKRIPRAMDDKTIPLRERLNRYARENGMYQAIDNTLRKAAAGSLSRMERVLFRFLKRQMDDGADQISPGDDSTGVELEAGHALEEAADALKSLVRVLYADSSQHRRIQSGLLLALTQTVKAARLLGKLKVLKRQDDFFRDF